MSAFRPAAPEGSTRWLFWHRRDLRLARQPPRAWPPPCPCHRCCHWCGYVDRSARGWRSGSNSGAAVVLGESLGANSRQGLAAPPAANCWCCTVTPRAAAQVAATIGAAWWPETGKWSGPAGARPQSGRHPAGRWRKCSRAGHSLLVPPDTLSTGSGRSLSASIVALLGAFGGNSWRRGPPPHLTPPGAPAALQDLDAAASQALES